ncbi:hypothetical protein L6452_21640 [Arctium lappa]|uniref:Uncharacterized protein n=1 Tax=Arctium lappa TaxID=4217 RepID=A0ACB9AXL7_ARCLA|nr:hypothetical protein L6452_21640 [Arctium lappa]
MILHHLASWDLEPQNPHLHLPHQVQSVGARVEELDWVSSESLVIFNSSSVVVIQALGGGSLGRHHVGGCQDLRRRGISSVVVLGRVGPFGCSLWHQGISSLGWNLSRIRRDTLVFMSLGVMR